MACSAMRPRSPICSTRPGWASRAWRSSWTALRSPAWPRSSRALSSIGKVSCDVGPVVCILESPPCGGLLVEAEAYHLRRNQEVGGVVEPGEGEEGRLVPALGLGQGVPAGPPRRLATAYGGGHEFGGRAG